MDNNSLFPLKYRLRKTDEPVEIVAWETAEKGARSENDWVSYIDANGVEHIKEHLTLEWDFVIDSPLESMMKQLDPCCTHENAKCERHYTIEDDGLTKKWGGGRNESILQSSIWARDRKVGQEVLRGEQKLRSCGYAHSRQDRHGLFPRLHLSQGQGNPLHPWQASFQRLKAGSAVPVNGSSVLI